MTENNNTMSELDFKALELKVNQLIAVCKSLAERNKILEEEKVAFRTERSRAMQQKEQVRGKVEAMITRLKSMES